MYRISLGVCFLAMAAFALTGNFLFLAVPVGYLLLLTMGLRWKTAYWVLLFCIPFSMHLEFANGALATSLPDEPMMWLFLLLFGVLWAHRPNMIPQWWWRNPIVLVVTLQFLWLIVAVIYSKEPLFSVKFLAAKCWFLVCFFILPIWVFTEKKDYKRAFLVFLIPTVGTMLAIFIRHAMLGFNFRRVEKAIMGIYYNHVDYSTILSMVFPLLLVAYPLTKGKGWWVRLPLIAVIIFFLPAIYLTYARAAIVAVVFAFCIWFAIRLKLVNLVMPVFYGLVTLMVVYMVRHNEYIKYRPVFQHTYMHKTFTDHIVATFRGEDMSSMERLYRWVAGARMSTENPVTGVGPNAFYYYYKPHAVSSFRTYVSRNVEKSTTHNYFLLMLVEQGWPAMILYAILIMVIFAQAQKIYYRFRKVGDRYYRNVTLGVIMMIAACFINNFFSELLETHKVGALFYLGIGLLVLLDKKSKDMEAIQQQEAANEHQPW